MPLTPHDEDLILFPRKDLHDDAIELVEGMNSRPDPTIVEFGLGADEAKPGILSTLFSGASTLFAGASPLATLAASLIPNKAQAAQAKAAEKAAKAQQKTAQLQLKAVKAQAGGQVATEEARRKWVLPAVIGGGAIVAAVVAFAVLRKKKRS